MELKNNIYAVKRQLEKVYNGRNLAQKEDQLRLLKQELAQLQEEKEGLEKIKREQAGHLTQISNEEQYQQRLQ